MNHEKLIGWSVVELFQFMKESDTFVSLINFAIYVFIE